MSRIFFATTIGVALLARAGAAPASCQPIPDAGKHVTLVVESCEEIKGLDVLAKAYPDQAASSTPEKEALMALYDGRVVAGHVRLGKKGKNDKAQPLQSKDYKVFVASAGPSCVQMAGAKLKGVLNYNCCDGDLGVPCLLVGVEAALDNPVVVKRLKAGKQTK